MTTFLTPRHLGRHSARVSISEASRNVAETLQKVAVTSTVDGATAGATGGRP